MAEAIASLAPRLLEDLSAWVAGLKGPLWSTPPAMGRVVHSLSVLLPICCESGANSNPASTEALLAAITRNVADLQPGEFATFAEMCTLADADRLRETAPEPGEEPAPQLQRALALRTELYRRAQDMPVAELPRSLAALLQLVPEEELVPTLRRCSGRLCLVISEQLRSRQAGPISGDALGEILYVFAACTYKDEELLDSCRDLLLAPALDVLGQVKRAVSLIHILHSLAVLDAASGELLHSLVAALEARIGDLGPFELVGLLDAAVLLQAQADGQPAASAESGPPPSGIGERALQMVAERIETVLPEMQGEELQLCAQLLGRLRMPLSARPSVARILEATGPATGSEETSGGPES